MNRLKETTEIEIEYNNGGGNPKIDFKPEGTE